MLEYYSRAIRQCRSLSAAISLHARIVAGGHGNDPDLAALLIRLYTSCGSADRAQSLFQSLPRKSALCWNYLIDAVSRSGHGDEALSLYRRMSLEGDAAPDRHTFVRVLSSCRSLRQGIAIHEQISSSGMDFEPMLQNSLVAMYGRCLRVDLARYVFQSIQEKNVVSWNAMISACTQSGHIGDAIETFYSMIDWGGQPNGISLALVLGACDNLEVGRTIHTRTLARFPAVFAFAEAQTSVVSFYSKLGRVDLAREFVERSRGKLTGVAAWNAMIGGYSQHGYTKEALEVYRLIDLDGLRPDHRTVTAVLAACSRAGNFETGKMVYTRAVSCGFDKDDPVLRVAAVSFYGKCGRVADARRVFDCIEKKSVVAWTAMIGVYAQNGYSSQAMEVYNAMEVPPNEITYATVLPACSSLEQGRTIHRRMLGSKLKFGLVLETALVKMFATFDDCVSARKVFDRIEKRDVVAWNTMLAGYVQNGRAAEALELSEDMEMEPDLTTVSTLLSACSAAGDLGSGKKFHGLLIEKKMFLGDAVLCSSLINMYAKCGSFGTARQVFRTARAGLSGSLVLWNTYLGAISHSGDWTHSLETLLEMEVEGVSPDSTSFVCALVACNHAGLLQRGKLLFDIMVSDHSARPTMDHFVCMADLLGRSGRMELAREVVDWMPFEADGVAWKALLGSFRGNTSLEGAAFAAERLVEMNGEELGQASVLLSNVYTFHNL